MRGAQLFEMVEKRGQPFYLIELKLYLISKSRAKALDLREDRGVRISQRRGPLGRRILVLVLVLVLGLVMVLVLVLFLVLLVVLVLVLVLVLVQIQLNLRLRKLYVFMISVFL